MNISPQMYGPWVFITGASSGIGAEFVRQLAAKGFHIAMAARNQEAMQTLAQEMEAQYKIQTKIFISDLSQPNFFETLQPQLDSLPIGLVIHSAGFSITGDYIDTDLPHQLALLHVNVNAALILAHYFGGRFKEAQKGGIILISSTLGFSPSPLWATYGASKAHLISFGEALASELKPYHVKLMVLCPGSTRTNFQAAAGVNLDQIGSLKNLLTMSAPDVVTQGLRAFGHHSIYVPGAFNKLNVLLNKFLPWRLSAYLNSLILHRLQEK